MNFFKKLSFLLKKPSVILVIGKGRSCATQAILQVLNPQLKKEKILIFESGLLDPKEIKRFEFLLKRSRLPILVATRVGEIFPDKDFFAGERKETLQIKKLVKILPERGFLILNFDDETIREIQEEARARSLTYGFQEGADFWVSDINVNLNGTNFKMDYQENIIPFWLKNLFGKEQIYSALAAIAGGVAKEINLVEISQILRNYKSLPGKMKLISGIKRSSIIDDSESATAFSMIEALGVLGKIEITGRKIAVLGDVLGIGKYTIEAHEAIGEKVSQVADLLFTVGARADFIAKGARSKGMLEEKIFQFDNIEKAKKALQDEMKEGDLVLIDGSKEMKMEEMVEEIRA